MALKPRWSIWINPRFSIGLTIGAWRPFRRPPDSHQSSTSGLAWRTTTCKFAWCLLFSISSICTPISVGLETRRQIRLWALFLLLILFRQRYQRAPMISVFVSCHLDIKAVKEAVTSYENIAGAKIDFDQSESLLGGPFRWRGGPIRILGVWFRPRLQLERNWSEVQAKVETQMGTWLRKRLSFKGRVEVCAMYIFHLIFYRLSVLPLSKNHRLALQWFLSKVIWRGQSPMVRRQVCCQRPSNGGLSMPDLENHWFVERLAYLGRSLPMDLVWRRKASDSFPCLKADPKADGRRKLRGETPFVQECRPALRNLPWSSNLLGLDRSCIGN